VQTADNATTRTTYVANQATVSDPTGITRQMTTDGLGRLSTVVEDPGTPPQHLAYSTSYVYDVLDNLKTVTQSGQTRTFTYDSRSFLVNAVNPENSVSYTYDDNGNLTQRTSGAATVNYSYDALNRVTLASYGGVTTPAVTYCYDGQVAATGDGNCQSGSAPNSIGRLTEVSSSVSQTSFTGYDALGRISGSTQVTSGQTFGFQYGYDFAGNLLLESYPSGRTVLNGYDGAGRLCSVSSLIGTPPAPPYACTGAGSTVYAGSIQYAPHGGVQTFVRGDTLTETWSYDAKRLWPTQIQAGSALTLGLQYFSNGNPSGQSINVQGTVLNQAYGYDAANRLNSIQETPNSQTYTYDPMGNRAGQNGGSQQFPLSSFLPGTTSGYNGNNQLTAGQYTDGQGNLNGIGAMTFGYDAENRLTTTLLSSNTVTYQYDGNGQRVVKQTPSGTTIFAYDAMGNLAAEYTTAAGTNPQCETCYVTVDHLGSTRMLTTNYGYALEQHDYLPFGDELFAGVGARTTGMGYLTNATTETVNVLFTGQYRDRELAGSAMPSGLDYFGARHMAPALGRFLSPDPANAGADGSIPQSWHGYSYVMNSPLVYTDPSGMDPFNPGDDPCADDPLCGWDWPPIWGWPGGGWPSAPPPPPAPLPNPTPPSGIPNTTGVYGQDQYGVPAWSAGPNGFLPVAAGIGTIGGVVCVGSGVCEVTAVILAGGAAVYGSYELGTWIGHHIIFSKASKTSGKEKATDVPSWAAYNPKLPGESCAEYAARILLEQYGAEDPRAFERGPGSEYNKIKKACERGGL
jgi:RHS repeat-associated protein